MAKVRVYNDNVFDHEEKFRGDIVKIPAKGFVEMEREDAVLFKSQFTSPKFGGDGVQEMESYKMIRLAPIENQAPDVPVNSDHICMVCGFEAKSKSGLLAHARAQHKEQMIDDEE